MNEKIFFYLYNISGNNHTLDKVIVFFADILPYIVIVLAFVLLIFHNDVLKTNNPFKKFIDKWKEFFYIFFSGFFAWVLAYLFKYIFHTPRPFDAYQNVFALIHETGYSFPSGHATFFSALAFAIYFKHKKAGYIFITLAVLIGLARIMAGVHFPVDILGGFVLGLLIAFLLKNR